MLLIFIVEFISQNVLCLRIEILLEARHCRCSLQPANIVHPYMRLLLGPGQRGSPLRVLLVRSLQLWRQYDYMVRGWLIESLHLMTSSAAPT